MDESRTVPAAPAPVAEEFSTSGASAIAENYENQSFGTYDGPLTWRSSQNAGVGVVCCAGQDVPGVGWQHSPECPCGSCLICGAPRDANGLCSKNSEQDDSTLEDAPKSQREETAPAGEDDHSGTGMGLRGLQERICLKCGKRGGIWNAEYSPLSEVYLSDLALNQCVGMATKGHGHFIYTHVCQIGSARKGGAL
jgi:hypothetical protein